MLALLFSSGTAAANQIGGAMLMIRALSYGLSLVLFVEALRKIGSTRTTTFFAIGPFVGTLLSVALLGERPSTAYWFAVSLVLGGVFLLYNEIHRHPHEEGEAAAVHEHPHLHEVSTHTHGHWPDIHHRHTHLGPFQSRS